MWAAASFVYNIALIITAVNDIYRSFEMSSFEMIDTRISAGNRMPAPLSPLVISDRSLSRTRTLPDTQTLPGAPLTAQKCRCLVDGLPGRSDSKMPLGTPAETTQELEMPM